jgi:hypothetical protein
VPVEGDPQQSIETLDGKIWKKTIAKTDLGAVEREHAVISTRLVAGRTVVNVYSDTQPEGFDPVPASLEDVYFSTLHHAKAARAEAA